MLSRIGQALCDGEFKQDNQDITHRGDGTEQPFADIEIRDMQDSPRCQPDNRRICLGKDAEKRNHHDSRRRTWYEVFEEVTAFRGFSWKKVNAIIIPPLAAASRTVRDTQRYLPTA